MKNNYKIFEKKVDSLLWYILYALPIILLTLSMLNRAITLDTIFAEYLPVLKDNFVYNTLYPIFGSEGYLPFLGEGLLTYFSYVILVSLVHLFVDIVVFIPRAVHNFIDKGSDRVC